MSEKSYYSIVRDWLVQKYEAEPVGSDFQIEGLDIPLGDVVVKRDDQLYVCEVKDMAYPLWSVGSGAIRQAMAHGLKANLVYVGCVASDVFERKGCSWAYALTTKAKKGTLALLDIEVPNSFEEYLKVVEKMFDTLWGDLGTGLLVVHDLRHDADPNHCDVLVVREAGPKGHLTSACS